MEVFEELDFVALTLDLPQYGLGAGDIGSVIEVLPDAAAIVLFPDSDGDTVAILTLASGQLRRPSEEEAETHPRPAPARADQHIAIADVRALQPPAASLSHVDDAGQVRMVDVTAKDETLRVATAQGWVVMQSQTLQLLLRGEIAKGNVLTTAQVAGVMAAKRTHELIPMCHPLLLTGIDVQLTPDEAARAVEITATVRTTGKTGVEMEALTAVTVAGLTVYDMCKAVDRGMRLEGVHLVSKSGGTSGDYVAE
jgi:cyclic pyranopterin phosphate synthase